MLRTKFFPSRWHDMIPKFYYPKLPILKSLLWKSCGIIRSSLKGFFNRLPTWGICQNCNICSFRCHTNMFLIFCRSNHKCLIINPSYHLSSVHFLIMLHTHLSLSHPIVAHLSHCQCGHTIDDLGIHLLLCPCGNECIKTHDIIQDTINTIALEGEAHVQKGFPTFSFTTFNTKSIFLSWKTIFEP